MPLTPPPRPEPPAAGAAATPQAARRRWLALAATLPLAGCGFALRKTPAMPFQRLRLDGAAERSPLAAELRTRLAAGGVQVLGSATPATVAGGAANVPDVVLALLDDRRDKRVVASTAAGQVRELQLRVTLQFRLSTPGGRELIAPTTLSLSRDMSYSETGALAKAQEEAELYAGMQADIVQQVLRRLASAPAGP